MTSPTAPSPGLGERAGEDLTPDEIAEIMAEEPPHQPAPPPTPVRDRYYLTECEHCGWIGSSEHLGVCDDDISCPVCCQSICGDGPDEADTAKHGEAVYQRIVTAEAAASTLRTENETLRAERDAAIAGAEEAERRLGQRPLTASDLAEALECFSNPVVSAMHSGTATECCIAQGMDAVAWRLREMDRLAALTTPEHPHGD